MTDLHILWTGLQFLEVPQKVFFLHFFTTFFDTIGLIGSTKTLSKGVGMNVGPYVAYILYIYICLSFIQNRGFWMSKILSS